MKLSIIVLRMIHGLFAIYFIGCLLYLYYSAFTGQITWLTKLSLVSLALEGTAVFILNKGDCPLIHVQKNIGDPVPFFNLIFPEKFAKKAIPLFAVLAIIGLLLFILRMIVK